MSLCLLMALALSACSLFPKVQPEFYQPDQSYLEPTRTPTLPVPLTNGALVKGISDLRGALTSCNDDKAAVRLWFSTVTQSKE